MSVNKWREPIEETVFKLGWLLVAYVIFDLWLYLANGDQKLQTSKYYLWFVNDLVSWS